MLKESLKEDLVLVDFDGTSKEEVIDKLLDLLASSGKVKDREQARQDVKANEAAMSTGMQHGIAIPHAKTDAVDELLSAVLITRNSVDYQSMDGKPARIFIMTLSPKDDTGPHLRFLAEIGKILKKRRLRKRILAAGSNSELYRILTSEG
jgi:PTS system nitrogen regulatory IIA component